MNKLTKKEVTLKLKSMTIKESLEYLNFVKENANIDVDNLIEKIMKKKQSEEKELERLDKMLYFEREAFKEGFSSIAGIDEAGRGPLAGPVVCSAVILNPKETILGLNDSKKVSEKKRDSLFEEINKKAASVAISFSEPNEIDTINIKKATLKAMKTLIPKLSIHPDLLLIDAEKIDNLDIPQKSIIKGDTLSLSIAAASIIAKVTRDAYMKKMAEKYPAYGFEKHKGYGTKEHIDAIKKFGICPIHRLSFVKNI